MRLQSSVSMNNMTASWDRDLSSIYSAGQWWVLVLVVNLWIEIYLSKETYCNLNNEVAKFLIENKLNYYLESGL